MRDSGISAVPRLTFWVDHSYYGARATKWQVRLEDGNPTIVSAAVGCAVYFGISGRGLLCRRIPATSICWLSLHSTRLRRDSRTGWRFGRESRSYIHSMP